MEYFEQLSLFNENDFISPVDLLKKRINMIIDMWQDYEINSNQCIEWIYTLANDNKTIDK